MNTSSTENPELKVFVKINSQTLLAGNKMNLNVDALVMRGNSTVSHKPVIFEVAGNQKQVTTPENGLIENRGLVFDYVEGVRTKLKAWAKGSETQVSEYDVTLESYGSTLLDSAAKTVRAEISEEFKQREEKLSEEFKQREEELIRDLESKNKQLVQKPEEELSRANAEFLASPNRKAEYAARKAMLKNKEQATGMPTFEECIEAMKKKGNKVLNALRAKTQDPRLTIAVIVGKDGKVKSFRPGFIEAKADPDFLRDKANPKNYVGKHYDKVYADLSPHGLREPDFDEYCAIDQFGHGYTMLDMENRVDKVASVPLADEFTGNPYQYWNLPGDQNEYLVSRPSVWGDDLPPKN
ncbi:MAG: hypothetical protein WC843_04345 [Candidatus Gracilibacteria bacterium]|jgi:hypothetical protein